MKLNLKVLHRKIEVLWRTERLFQVSWQTLKRLLMWLAQCLIELWGFLEFLLGLAFSFIHSGNIGLGESRWVKCTKALQLFLALIRLFPTVVCSVTSEFVNLDKLEGTWDHIDWFLYRHDTLILVVSTHTQTHTDTYTYTQKHICWGEESWWIKSDK